MKLTDEQMDKMRKSLENAVPSPWCMVDDALISLADKITIGNVYDEENQELIANSPEWIRALLSSEQAWKEEAEQLQEENRVLKSGAFPVLATMIHNEQKSRLNQAIEALKRLLDNNQLRTGEDAKEARIEIMYILSSLSQGTEVNHE